MTRSCSCSRGCALRTLAPRTVTQACASNSSCSYVCHADTTDLRCMLYGSCPDVMCNPSGPIGHWFTTYQYGRQGAAPWTNCIFPPTPPPVASDLTQVIVDPAIVASHGAKCLDGTPPAYAIRRGVGGNASRFILFMEGGGWCFGVDDCAGRRGGGLGTSSGYSNGGTKGDLGGVMAFNSTTNPDFHTYVNAVMFTRLCRSCPAWSCCGCMGCLFLSSLVSFLTSKTVVAIRSWGWLSFF
jgi:hypothetical protein